MVVVATRERCRRRGSARRGGGGGGGEGAIDGYTVQGGKRGEKTGGDGPVT